VKTRYLTAVHSILATCLLPLSGAAQTVTPQEVGLSAERLERINEVVDRYLEAGDITGAVTLVGKDGRIAHLEAHGIMDIASDKPMSTDSIFRIASMSKPVGSVAILILIEEGKVRLSDPVSRFIPSYRGMQVAIAQPPRPAFGPGGPPPPSGPPTAGPGAPPPEFYTVPAERDITILDLLTHTSGLMSGAMGNSVTRPAVEARHEKGVAYTEEIGTAPLEFQPGARWSYSAVGGFDVLSRVVEIVSGQSFSDFTRARIFGPLGMNDTTFWPTSEQRARLVTSYIRRNNELVPRDNPDDMSGDRYFSAAGGVMTTARDYAQFAMMLANGGELNGRRILSRRSVKLMGSAYIPDTLQGRRAGESFGLGVRVVTNPALRGTWLSEGSFGWDGVYGTRFWVDPKENLVGIIFTQTTVVPLLNDFETAVMQAVE
jgi:CubicO group peptidase (beta-lactamase class C family)